MFSQLTALVSSAFNSVEQANQKAPTSETTSKYRPKLEGSIKPGINAPAKCQHLKNLLKEAVAGGDGSDNKREAFFATLDDCPVYVAVTKQGDKEYPQITLSDTGEKYVSLYTDQEEASNSMPDSTDVVFTRHEFALYAPRISEAGKPGDRLGFIVNGSNPDHVRVHPQDVSEYLKAMQPLVG